jgi:ABC transporter substrate binding protein
MDRRSFITMVGGSILAAPLTVDAQQSRKVSRIGFLSAAIPDPPTLDGFRQGLREHGYIEGHNLLVEWRFAEGRNDRLPGFAEELVRLKVEVLVTLAPAALGVVSSLARPGGNLTGFSILGVELTGKRLELFQEAVPSLKSVVILTDTANPNNALAVKEAQIAARRLGLEWRLIEVRDANELEPAFITMARERARGVVLVPSSARFS